MERKVVLYIAASLDGYIARTNGDIDWLSLVEKPNKDYGYNEFIHTVDTVIMGRKTYEKILSFGIKFPHKNKKCFVVTRAKKNSEGNVIFYNKDVGDLIAQLKINNGKNIFIDGGAEVVNELMKKNLIDEYVISIIPLVLGNGIRLFKELNSELQLSLIACKKFDSGLVQLHYKRFTNIHNK